MKDTAGYSRDRRMLFKLLRGIPTRWIKDVAEAASSEVSYTGSTKADMLDDFLKAKCLGVDAMGMGCRHYWQAFQRGLDALLTLQNTHRINERDWLSKARNDARRVKEAIKRHLKETGNETPDNRL